MCLVTDVRTQEEIPGKVEVKVRFPEKPMCILSLEGGKGFPGRENSLGVPELPKGGVPGPSARRDQLRCRHGTRFRPMRARL